MYYHGKSTEMVQAQMDDGVDFRNNQTSLALGDEHYKMKVGNTKTELDRHHKTRFKGYWPAP